MRNAFLISLIAAVHGSGFVSSAAAQGADASRPAWRAQYPRDLGELMTAAERAAATATLAEIERILWRVPELARPREFEVLKQEYGGSTPFGEQQGLHRRRGGAAR